MLLLWTFRKLFAQFGIVCNDLETLPKYTLVNKLKFLGNSFEIYMKIENVLNKPRILLYVRGDWVHPQPHPKKNGPPALPVVVGGWVHPPPPLHPCDCGVGAVGLAGWTKVG